MSGAAECLRRHWLTDVIERAALAPQDGAAIDATAGPADAWQFAARACGITEDELATHVAAHFMLQVATLAAAEPRALRLLPERVARKHTIFPLRENDRELVVATSNPTDLSIENDVAFSSGRQPVLEIAPPGAILDCIASAYAPAPTDNTHIVDDCDDVADAIKLLENVGPVAVDAREVEFAPVIKLTNVVLRAAIDERASDIHIEPGPLEGVVRFRVDGVLHNYMKMPLPAHNRVISRIKIMGKLDIADRLRPQDGRASISVAGRSYDLRISSVPTRIAEKVVIRILGQGGSTKLSDIDIPADQLSAIRSLLSHRNGIVPVTGPTGSGKTTTLYAALRELATGEENIMTVEDPVEYELAGITQIQVESKRGLTFAAALRSLLRQDPDIILVGEIRDAETANIAAQASMTGHLVLATLHTNNAIGAVQRLMDLGLDRASIAATLRGVVAQRLVRKLCLHCAEKMNGELNAGERRLASQFGVVPTMRAVGCARCLKSGYMGRVPVMEVLTLNPTLTSMISSGASMDQLQLAAVGGGMRSVRDTSIQRVATGQTTLEELERVVGTRTDSSPTAEAAHEENAGMPSAAAPLETMIVTATPGGAPADEAAAATPRLPLGEVAPAAARLPRILIVEDEKVNRKVARALLQKNGFDVVECEDGQQGIEQLQADPDFSLVLLDLDMPRVDGRTMLRWVRATPATRPLPVVIFTASQGETLEAEVMDEGADDYIRKPLDPPRFIARIRATLRRAAA
ncbi:MAG: Flp pilus assembly complex ATPase component TadA [Candidatus Eisenbacteria bacterium]|nr:Flp pilus assembly complex ATPase component TadA [Candidatus Eisenbacteria bacterium]